ncbi:MAG: LytTR family DNA-binding domain-containing protein [Acidobacteriota bacterium]
MNEDSGSMLSFAKQTGKIHRIRMVIVADDPWDQDKDLPNYKVPVEFEVERRNSEHAVPLLEVGTSRVAKRKRYAHRLPVKRSGGVVLYIETRRIRWVEAVNQYVRLYVEKEKYLIRDSLTHLEKRLEPRRFQRIHRSSIVNLERVRELHMESSNFRWAVLDNGIRLRVSQGYWNKLQNKMQGLT